MSDVAMFGFTSMLVCFVFSTYFITRAPEDFFPEEYEFSSDPIWYILAFLFVGGTGTFILFPEHMDTIKDYKIWDFILPIIFAAIIYIAYLIGNEWFSNFLIFTLAYIMCLIQPDTFILFPEHLEPWQDRLVVSAILFTITKGLGLLNGLAAIASMQFLCVMISTIALYFLGVAPSILFVMAMCYTGVMLSFAFLSWPPEKLLMNNDAWSSLGFVLGCFALNMAVECSDASIFIALSYLFTEVIMAVYNKYIANKSYEHLYMSTSYYTISNEGEEEERVVYGVLKIFIVCVLLSMAQTISIERIALPVFSVALNLWFLSILSGETKPEGFFSITKLGFRTVKKILSQSSGVETVEVVEVEEDKSTVKKKANPKKAKKTAPTKTTTKNKTTNTKKKDTVKNSKSK